MASCKGWTKKGSLEEFWNDTHLEDKERENLEIRGCKRLHKECKRGNWQLGMDRQRKMEKEN